MNLPLYLILNRCWYLFKYSAVYFFACLSKTYISLKTINIWNKIMLFLKCIYLHQPIPCTGISKFSMSNFVHEWKKSQPANFVSLQEPISFYRLIILWKRHIVQKRMHLYTLALLGIIWIVTFYILLKFKHLSTEVTFYLHFDFCRASYAILTLVSKTGRLWCVMIINCRALATRLVCSSRESKLK
jgi:hypothetical protein